MSETNRPAPSSDLGALRQRIDELDRQLIDVLTQRLEVCHEVARLKETTDTPIIQPQRVRDVITTRRQWAIDNAVDPDFVEQVVRTVLAETHRIEVARGRSDDAPDKPAAENKTSSPIDAAIDTVATRIDHVVVAVNDLAQAVEGFTNRLGFHRLTTDDGSPGIAAVAAGGVIIVLVGPQAGPQVASYLAEHGSGIHHIAIEVLNGAFARSMLLDAGSDSTVTPLIVDEKGHEQFFTVRDPDSNVQFGFIARTGHRHGVATHNVLEAFARHSHS